MNLLAMGDVCVSASHSVKDLQKLTFLEPAKLPKVAAGSGTNPRVRLVFLTTLRSTRSQSSMRLPGICCRLPAAKDSDRAGIGLQPMNE